MNVVKGLSMKIYVAALLILSLEIIPLSSETQKESMIETELREDGSSLLFDRYTPGLIFNTSNILLDLDGYQSGVGIKLKAEDYALRGLVRLSYESSDDFFETELGATYEKPFFDEKVSPYWGIETKGGYSLDRDEYSSDNWTESSVITASLSLLFGVEVFIYDYLSLFAEYSLGGSLSRTTFTSMSSGDKSKSTNLNYFFGAGLGNSASIGITIYLRQYDIVTEDIETENK